VAQAPAAAAVSWRPVWFVLRRAGWRLAGWGERVAQRDVPLVAVVHPWGVAVAYVRVMAAEWLP
jgi:hypothetical protein